MDLDYAKLGFKCGIEIHQQLDTHKLFCSCPSLIRDDQPDLVVERRMRAVAGELGDVDPAALHEFLRGRTLLYEAYHDSTCLVELDEEPPHPLNQDALRTVLEVALLLKAEPVEEMHVMRKTVIDGSNTSGFQRTMLVAEDGTLETSKGHVGIPTICLEEDAARIISEEGGEVHYRLDRLGIPLIELATTPDIKDPQHAREVAEKIGGILRATTVKRGLGTIRQDINVSIAEGERIEVKGVQDLRLISKVVEGEVRRQMMLIDVRKELLKRGVKSEDYDAGHVDISRLFKDTKSSVISDALSNGGVVLAVNLRGLDGLLKDMLGPQLAQYARALAGVKGIFHGDELPAYGVSQGEAEATKRELGTTGVDSYTLVAAPREQALKALEAVLGRCKTALECVPEEVRRAREDGSTEYMRPLPGSSRMYPETDEPLVSVYAATLKSLKSSLPELRDDKAKRYVKMGLGKELADQLSRSAEAPLFESLAAEFEEADPNVIAQTLTSYPKEAVKRYGVDPSLLSEEHFRQVMSLLSDGRITKNVIVDLIAKAAENPDEDLSSLAESGNLTTLSDDELKKIVAKVKSENEGLNPGQLMGKVMAEVQGRADPSKVKDLLRG
ncbi:MAG: Glu-tRNA(Gln) amidotransferase subunit GatE [Candidatus Altiarchaeales archaeon]|nr:Glu-tRNA(Gln) amidotransferase subunit GatE [Candidatus Altiarchaeales archaeon]MBD3417097.1 Glu-tRNA(Gln) amidotransferase subunit GatE [Candidatus Altiarchaeales archaeon]